jgi:putative membrane-bound dehydrogenase-like protein
MMKDASMISHGMTIALCLWCAATHAQQSPKLDGPLEPQRAAESMQLERDLRLELVASEPRVVAPVAVAFDLKSRMFVVENRGYPLGPKPGEPPQGRIALLEDLDGNGTFDKRIEFAEGLSFPNGVLPWLDGAIVTCAPDILFLRDTDGDGKADSRDVIFTGFGTEGSTQLRVSHPTLGPDGWIYVTNGLSGGTVVSPKHPEMKPLVLGRNTFRFSPDFSKAELAAGPAQFGLTFDDFGRQFVCYNRVQAQLVMFTPDVVARAPNVAISSLLHNCPVDFEAEPLPGHGAAARIFPISQNITTADSHAGTFTAACGVTVVRGSGIGEKFRGGLLSCDPTANLIHFDQLVPQGAAIGAKRLPGGTEFLRSSDSWFRPVFLTFGPDGALYICDMYRKTIEHPDYLPTEVRKNTDFDSGREMGRIWRVARFGSPRSREKWSLSPRDASTAQIVEWFANGDTWIRDAAGRMMIEAPKDEFRKPLQLLIDRSARDDLLARAAEIATSYGIDIDRTLEEWLDAKSPQLREMAIRLLTPKILREPKWITAHEELAFDADPRVRFTLALSIGGVPSGNDMHDDAVCNVLALIASKGKLDHWTRTAILCGITARELRFLAHLKKVSYQLPIDLELIRESSRLVALAHAKEKQAEVAARVLRVFEGNFAECAAALRGAAEVWRNQGWLREGAFLASLGLSESPPAMMKALLALREDAVRILSDDEAKNEDRIAATAVLSLARWDRGEQALLAAMEQESLQIAALRALCGWRDASVAESLLSTEKWGSYKTAARDELLATLLAAPETIEPVLVRLERGELPIAAIDSLGRRQLTTHRDATIRVRAEKLFGAIAGNRAAVYESFKDVAEMAGSASNGRKAFQKGCANCHRLNREGFQVGPDLFGVRNQPKATILLHVIVPDQEITQGFHAYTALLNDGRTLNGLLANETPASVTLRLPQGKEETLARDQIEEFVRSPLSLMPQGIENTLSRQELADLLAYLKGEAETEPPAIPPTEKAP